MKKYFYILAALSLAPNFALAQSLDSEVDTELDQIAAQQMAPEASAAASQRSSVNQQPIYILNQGSPTATSNSGARSDQGQAQEQAQAQVQKQPTTLIQASPLTESRAEQIRKARQDAEVQTEQKIVEKLEISRMEDEKRRAAILFGDKFNQNQNVQVQQVQQVQQPVVVAPTVVAAPIVVEPKENTRDIVREEIRAAMRAEDEVVEAPLESRYFGGMVGIADYPGVGNVRTNYSLGAQFGTKYDNFIVEGTFLYSNLNVDMPYYSYMPPSVEVNQYSGALAAKYEFFGGMIRPVVGGLMQYSYRTFAWSNNTGYGYSNSSGPTSATSHAVDVGVVSGVDLVFTPKFTLALDYRYLWNLAYQANTSSVPWMTGPQYGTPIEKLSYYVLSIVGKVTF